MPLTVNGEPIPEEQVAHQLRLLQSSLGVPGEQPLPDDSRLYALAEENAVLQVLLHQAAHAGSPTIPEEDVARELARRRGTPQSTHCSPGERAEIVRSLQLERLLHEVTRNVPRPRTAEVEAAYRAQRDRFRRGESARVRHIVANLDGMRDENGARELLLAARTALDAGEPFAGVAERFSDCKGVGGDLGWIERGEMVLEFDEVVFALRPGAVSDIFPTVFGLHIATVIERRAPRVQPLSEVRGVLAQELLQDRRQTRVLEYLRGLAAQSDIRRTGEPE
jgi:peptidyl-prolyl cis-trans isomerase C